MRRSTPTSRLIKSLYAFVFIAALSCGQDNLATKQDILWYHQPANNWNEALPLGNGKLGVMVFGNPQTERIQLNDDSLWPADSQDWNEPPGTAEDLAKLRQLLIEGKNDLVDSLIVEKFSRKTIKRSHQTLGDLHLEFNHENITDYRRELNISDATSMVSYKVGGDQFVQKVFVSNPHKAIIIQLSSQSSNGITAKLKLSRPDDEGIPTVRITVENGQLIMEGEVTQRGGVFNSIETPIESGVKFETRLKPIIQNGEVIAVEDYLELKGVKEATLILVSNSSFYYDDFKGQNVLDINAIDGERISRFMGITCQRLSKILFKGQVKLGK